MPAQSPDTSPANRVRTDPTPVTVTSTDDSRALRLLSVLATALPPEIGTPDEPARYTVPAVFSRQVSAAERAYIEDPDTARALAAATGADPGLALAVADRRLLIMNTTLAELKGGLAAAIAQMLIRLGQELLMEMDRRDAAAERFAIDERARSEAVSRAAAEIRFAVADDHVGPGYGTDAADARE